MKEIRRQTRVVGSFPDGYSAMMLVGARLRHISTTKWGTLQYMNACKLYEGGRYKVKKAGDSACTTDQRAPEEQLSCTGGAELRLQSAVFWKQMHQNFRHNPTFTPQTLAA